MNSTCIIIPARFESIRLPGKPLIMLKEIPMVIRTALTCVKVVGRQNVYLTTDDSRIESVCKNYKIQCIRTSSKCLTGTDRVAEAYFELKDKYDIIVNVQGDEPLVLEENILTIINDFKKNKTTTTGACKINLEEDFLNYNIVKFAITSSNLLQYASRAGIPSNKTGKFFQHLCHVPIYAYTKKDLMKIYNQKNKTYLESIEDIEILRFLELGCKVSISILDKYLPAIDVKDDIKKVLNYL